MGSLFTAGVGGALSSGQARNAGQSTGLLGGPGAIDGTAQSFWNLADPFNTTGHASSGHVLSNILDPGNIFGQNQAANPYGPGGVGSQGGVPSVLPNLGAASMIPQMPQGAFQRLNGGGGIFNQMAANSMGGQIFNPGVRMPSPMAPQNTAFTKGAQPLPPHLLASLKGYIR